MNKSAGVLDHFFIIATVFVSAVSIFVALMIVNTTINTNVFADVPEAAAGINSAKNTILSMDNMMLFIIVGLSLFVVVSSALVFNHPAFFFIAIFLLMIAVTVSAVASNTFWVFTDNDAVAATAASFPKIVYLMNHFPFYIAFLGIAAVIAMYAGYRQQ
jgi:hypothetical protein